MLPYDPQEAVSHLSAADAGLARLIARVGPLALAPRTQETVFQLLMRSIIYQQLAGKAAATIHGRVLALLPPEPERQPAAVRALPDEALRGAGLSRAKLAAVRDLAVRTEAGLVPDRTRLAELADDEIVSRLVEVRGVGRWTVEMLLIFGLGRPDVLPVLDLGVRKGFMITYGLQDLPPPALLTEHGERWRPYRSVASWYLWRAVDLRTLDG